MKKINSILIKIFWTERLEPTEMAKICHSLKLKFDENKKKGKGGKRGKKGVKSRNEEKTSKTLIRILLRTWEVVAKRNLSNRIKSTIIERKNTGFNGGEIACD